MTESRREKKRRIPARLPSVAIPVKIAGIPLDCQVEKVPLPRWMRTVATAYRSRAAQPRRAARLLAPSSCSCLLPPDKASVPVVLRLVGTLDRHADVVRLLLRERRQLHAQVPEVKPRDLLVE